MVFFTTKEIMEGYIIDGASVYNKLGSPLKLSELQNLLCCICGYVLREAMQVTQCGHRFCKSCIEKITDQK